MKGFVPKLSKTGKKELNNKNAKSFIEIGMVSEDFKSKLTKKFKNKSHLVKGGVK